MKRKNLLLTIGSISSAALPVATVISCGVNEPSKVEIDNLFKIKSASAMTRVQEEFWWNIFKAEQTTPALTGNISENAYDVAIVKDMVDEVLRRHLSKDDKFLLNLMGKHLQTKAMNDIAAAQTPSAMTTHQLATKWNTLGLRPNGKIAGIDEEAKKFILKYDKSFRAEVLKSSVAYLFLNKKITRDEYKQVFMTEDDKFSDVQKIAEVADFNLINEAAKQHLFARWTVAMSSSNSLKYLSPEVKTFTNVAAADAAITSDNTGATSWIADMKYSDTHALAPAGILPLTGYEKLLGYKGIKAANGTRGKFKMDLNGLKLATNKESWNGYLQDDIVRSDIKYFPKDSNTVTIDRLFGFMPIYDGHQLTFTGSYFENAPERKMLAMALSANASSYSEAEKYYSTRKTNPIQLEILNKDLKEIAIEHGFKFIKE